MIWRWRDSPIRGKVAASTAASTRARRKVLLSTDVIMCSLQEVADALSVHRRTVVRMIQTGAIKAQRVGSGRGRWRVRLDDLKALTHQKEEP